MSEKEILKELRNQKRIMVFKKGKYFAVTVEVTNLFTKHQKK